MKKTLDTIQKILTNTLLFIKKILSQRRNITILCAIVGLVGIIIFIQNTDTRVLGLLWFAFIPWIVFIWVGVIWARGVETTNISYLQELEKENYQYQQWIKRLKESNKEYKLLLDKVMK
jgi:hypothetical protein